MRSLVIAGGLRAYVFLGDLFGFPFNSCILFIALCKEFRAPVVGASLNFRTHVVCKDFLTLFQIGVLRLGSF